MNESSGRALREELGAAPPPFLDELDEAELRQLTRALSEARARQAEAAEGAIGESLWFLPWGLRGAVRKAFWGEPPLSEDACGSRQARAAAR